MKYKNYLVLFVIVALSFVAIACVIRNKQDEYQIKQPSFKWLRHRI